ncbi:glutamic acid-rich protein-like isoform X9 [Plodia interpunctella]|uniref:glutamic acid-rich protein-like isoform X9 n=1 Tax=Plodia interpunctella TaxID=58824 RepID=UPI00236854E8|nr:glutamic acid-rich protein-like isoform X9 [Plodia interpunctella]
MIYQILFLCLLFFVDARSVEKVSERNVTKRAANTEFFPDWVPFKNKNGDELGEFVQVETKKKPKKRLAQPMNFKLKQLEPQGDYDDFGGGGGDINEGEDYEKKEWSDLYRSGIRIKPQNLSHTDLSDIDGLVNIITNSNPIREHRPLLVRTTKKPTTVIDDDDYLDQSKETDSQKRENREKYEQELTTNKKVQESANKTSDEDYNYEDDKKQKEKQEQMETERKESEARKALILNAVDELKARHEVEQRILSEKEKEEEIFKEEHERDRVDTDEGRDKYDRRKPKFRNFYDLYDDHFGQSTSYDKYDIIIEKTTPEPTTTVSTPRKSKKNKKRKNKKKKPVETPGQILVYNNPEKISVFKNPEAFMYKDDEESTTSTTKKPKLVPKRTTAHPKTRKTGKFSSKISMTPNSIVTSPKNREGSVRISLVPQASGSEESPALFFPQPNNRKKKRGKNTTANTDSYVDETVADITTNNYTTFDESVTNQTEIDATASDTKSIDVTSPPVKDAVVTNSDTVPDVVAAPTEKKQTNEGNYVHKKGGDREYTSSHEEVHRETGKKAYEGKHEETKQGKGHHDKEDHSGEYIDKAGTDKKHHDESNQYGAHHHEEHGKKHAKYEESGKHSKGHSTKGSHDIHKKEEYEKRVEFFEEDGDSSEEEKHGGFNHKREHSSGGHFKKANLEAGHHARDKGDAGHHQAGGHVNGHKGHKSSEGHDSHGRHYHAHFRESGMHSGNKWGHGHSSPAKISNVVAIDRRADQFYAGPQYYG